MKREIALITLLFTISITAIAQNAANKDETVTVCIPHVATAPGERIVGFEIELTAGWVQSVSHIPLGWYVEVDNASAWRTTIGGSISVGAAALDPNDLCKMHITVQKDTKYDQFAVSGTVTVTTDFEKTRNIAVAGTDFEVTKSTAK